ncbi:HD-GYP domain-containing protein [Roseibium sp.]|uniref:HD-GYP domain-containing protein n=1 Tax=Roseibium sp. TaxID=1936156 RepID=UPI003A96F065
MKRIVLVASTPTSVPELFKQVTLFFDASVVVLSEIRPEHLAESSLIIVDFAQSSGDQLSELKRLLKSYPDLMRVGLVSLFRRQEIVQAKALGLSELWDRASDTEEVVTTIRAMVGNYSMPQLPADLPEVTKIAANSMCSSLDAMAMAAISGKRLPLQSAAKSIQALTAVLQQEKIDTWLAAVQSHHSHTFCHSMMVAGFAVAFGAALELDANQRAILGVGALVHDLGKVRIPLSILDKPGKLTSEEFAEIKKHPVYSMEILKGRPEVPPAILELAVSHHEYLDGSGYPRQLRGDEISQLVRMLTICDIYAALTEKRSYKESYGPRQAYAILMDMNDKLDKDLLKKFRPVIFDADVGKARRGRAA